MSTDDETIWVVEADTYRAERDWDGEPNPIRAGRARGDAASRAADWR